jgi:TonB-linked SusC/RagA family outer membrane protein
LLFLLFSGFTTFNSEAQQRVSGVVKDVDGVTLPSVTVIQKGTNRGTVTDFDGKYSLALAEGEKVLVFSYLGFKTLEVAVNNKTTIDVTLEIESESLDEVVVVGYGTQKKSSVVAAIAQVKGETLMERSGGLTNVEEALQGNLPGVVAIQGSGIPGQSDVRIFIRGQSSWNGNGAPLILVDGVERQMSDIDFNDVETISVLKDATATAVFGVQGGDGVILVTTKRGKKGKAQLTLSVNSTIKTVSKLPQKLDSFDAVNQANQSILRELAVVPTSWGDYTPASIVDKYRNPLTPEEAFIYPNIDWANEILKDFAQDYRINLSVRGGNDSAKYFGSLAYQTVDDIFDGSKYDSGKGYLGEYNYQRFNYRTNIDFNITKTTEVSVNLAGYLGIRESPSNLNTVTNSIYEIASNLYTPVFPDGAYGQFRDDGFGITNSIVSLTNTGYDTFTDFQVNTDFILKQKLDFITKGLRFKGRFSLDNTMTSRQQLNDNGADGFENVVYRVYDANGNEQILSPFGVNDFDFVPFPWTIGPSTVLDNGGDGNRGRYRNLLYDLSLNYSRVFADKHDVAALFLLRRQETAVSSNFPTLRENWVGRVTYNYDTRYFLEVAGAVNGSERFGPGFRFDLFPSLALGWTVSNESFMEDVEWINNLKIRASYGVTGSDKLPGGEDGRFNYLSRWDNGGAAFLNSNAYNGRSPYTFFTELTVGNPNLQWETAEKLNIGTDFAFFNNLITGEFNYFTEKRENIIIVGEDRAVPDFFGIAPPDFNAGAVEVEGYELVLGFNHTFENDLNIFGDFSFTQAVDEVITREDPLFTPFYQRSAGYPLGQLRSAIPAGILTSWDDIYSSTPTINNQDLRRIGYYNVVDFDGNGVYDAQFDNTPFGFPTRPQRTWAATLGAAYKAFRLSVQLYGTQNTVRNFGRRTFNNQTALVFEEDLNYWTKETPNNTQTLPGWRADADTDPRRNFFDASVTRLRAVSLSYNVPKKTCEKLGLKSLQLFANGNNLFLWTDLPDDREFNGTITNGSNFRGDYPTLKRYNFGFNLNF